MTVRTPRGKGLVLGAMIVALILVSTYWIIWYGVDRNILASSHAASYYTFENAFPLADAWLALALVFGIAGLVRRRADGLLWILLGGGAGIFLGCIDVLFDLENHIYTGAPGADASAPVIEIAINVITFTFGIAIVTWAWRNRRWFLAEQ
ncbi:MAG TPA: hypothetical protein VGS80_09230 [Ktedonobacterales bacterium]|nr:hypothetical protein [Ktedonobacterales bacterium]